MSVTASKMVDVVQFKTLLIHLFAISILWSHFQNADDWEESGGNIGTKQLNYESFKLACRTMSSGYAKEELSDEQIRTDFHLLDENQSSTIGFIEVCNHCTKFVNDPEVDLKISVPKFFGNEKVKYISDDLMSGLEAGPKTYFENTSIDEKNKGLMLALQKKITDQEKNLKDVTKKEHQNNIRKKYSNIPDLINHPICCGFLLQFCESQHNSENLNFIREVDDFRELFMGDTKDENKWNKHWRDIDLKNKIDDDIVEEAEKPNIKLIQHKSERWGVKTDKTEKILDAIENLIMKYFNDDSDNQVSLSQEILQKTKKRINLVHLYGPVVFDEACIDPVKTLVKDIWPRFKQSDVLDYMVVGVASCEPPPPKCELIVPSPGMLLLTVSSPESLADGRQFSLDEIIGCQILYEEFSEYLKIQKNESIHNLICIRMIDVFNQLIVLNSYDEYYLKVWQIYRYFITEGAAYIIPIDSRDRKQIMLKLAEPRKDMFKYVRLAAYNLLKNDFISFSKTDEYLDLNVEMLKLKNDQE
mmetsp:Transcript_34206/g.32607  ORF Transcript_34206/g.32607 Transcript_34206/m.32607 type:complete len:529 (+) Transcript_34206:105-1691(+)